MQYSNQTQHNKIKPSVSIAAPPRTNPVVEAAIAWEDPRHNAEPVYARVKMLDGRHRQIHTGSCATHRIIRVSDLPRKRHGARSGLIVTPDMHERKRLMSNAPMHSLHARVSAHWRNVDS